MPERALLLVDVQRDVVRLIKGMEEVVRVGQEVLSHARRNGWLVLHLVDWHTPDDPEVLRVGEHCMADSPGAEVVPELAPREGERVLRKREQSGFSNPELKKVLRDEGVKEVYLLGDLCVHPNAKDLLARRFQPLVVEEAIADPFDTEKLKGELRAWGVPLISRADLP
jgi:nicotinamidase-related amidase